ncbi:MAG: type II toxin-antitoxin system RelE/ParE family toxin [Flavobacterium sp.]
MEIEPKKVIRSIFYLNDLQAIFEYGEANFGEKAALEFYEDLRNRVRNLEREYLLHPECRHLETKTKMYRNLILGSYLIKYRIRTNKVEVLRAFHDSRAPKTIRKASKIKP